MEYGRYKQIPNALRTCREAKGLSQTAVAKLLGFKDKTWISHWERGDALPNLVSAVKLSLLFSVSITELFPELIENLRGEFGSNRGNL